MVKRVKIKPGVRLSEQPECIGMNRWHPDIPFIASVKPGDELILESLDFFGLSDCQQ